MTDQLVSPSLLVPAMQSDLSQRAIESCAARLNDIDLNCLNIYDIDHVDASLLPYLAEQQNLFGEPEWELATTDATRRALIKIAPVLKSLKGTVAGLERVFDVLGFGPIRVEEGRGGRLRDGSITRDGYYVHGTRDVDWAVFRIFVPVLFSTAQAELARRICMRWQRNSCWLYQIVLGQSILHNGIAMRDGTYTYGGA